MLLALLGCGGVFNFQKKCIVNCKHNTWRAPNPHTINFSFEVAGLRKGLIIRLLDWDSTELLHPIHTGTPYCDCALSRRLASGLIINPPLELRRSLGYTNRCLTHLHWVLSWVDSMRLSTGWSSTEASTTTSQAIGHFLLISIFVIPCFQRNSNYF